MNPLFRFPSANRPLRIETPLGVDTFAVLELSGHEGISELYSFDVSLAADRYTSVAFDALLGKCATIHISTPELGERTIHGMIAKLSRTADDESLAYYSAQIVPLFWLWTKRRQSRIFQQLAVPDILKLVFDGLETRFQLSGQYLSRDYCVQYDETDFDFAARLLAEEGLFYYFEHRVDGHTLVIMDDVANLPAPGLLETVQFEPQTGAARDWPSVWNWTKEQQVVTSKFTAWDQCFELPGQNLEAETNLQQVIKVGSDDHKLVCRAEDQENYQYPGQYAKWFDGVQPGGGDRAADVQHIYQEKDRRVRLHAEAVGANAVLLSGEGNFLKHTPAARFAMFHHSWGDGKYMVVRVEHQAQSRVPSRSKDEAVSFSYENRFTALPDGLAYRPPTINKPRIVGPQTAVVTGPQGQEVFVDKYGRVKVQFPWDRQGKFNADSSCWVRVAQFWAGKRFGAFFWPRIGHEVVVAFEDGDPDRPLIIGSVYNAANMPPLTLPNEVKLTGIKSCIYGGDSMSKYSAIVFHDVPGQEYVHIHSETHSMQNSESDNFQFVPDSHYEFHGSF